MLNKIKNLFGTDTKQREEKDAIDEALAGLEGLIAKASRLSPLERQVINEKAAWLMKRAGCATFTQYLVGERHTCFIVPANVDWSLDPLGDYLIEAQAMFSRERDELSSILVLGHDYLLDLPKAEPVDESKELGDALIAELDEKEKAREFLDSVAQNMGMSNAQELVDKVDELADEPDDEDDTVGVTAARLRQLQVVERAASQLLNHAEYRVNHVFKGDSKSYYVRFDDLEKLKEAFK